MLKTLHPKDTYSQSFERKKAAEKSFPVPALPLRALPRPGRLPPLLPLPPGTRGAVTDGARGSAERETCSCTLHVDWWSKGCGRLGSLPGPSSPSFILTPKEYSPKTNTASGKRERRPWRDFFWLSPTVQRQGFHVGRLSWGEHCWGNRGFVLSLVSKAHGK